MRTPPTKRQRTAALQDLADGANGVAMRESVLDCGSPLPLLSGTMPANPPTMMTYLLHAAAYSMRCE